LLSKDLGLHLLQATWSVLKVPSRNRCRGLLCRRL
jgi:hypothetical protein